MKNLGRVLIVLVLFTNIIYASVVADIEPKIVYEGDSVTYHLTISGRDVKKPALSDICGNEITATGSQTSIQYINGDYQKSYILSYEFSAKKSCVIAPTEVEVDSSIESSNSVKMKVKPRGQDINADFVLSLEASKKELYVGEPFTLTLLLKQKDGVNALDNKFVAPGFKGFWMKSEGNTQRGRGSGYTVTKVEYKLAPQREGNLTITPAQLKIATRSGGNNWGTLIPQVKWRSYYSNELSLKIKALPSDAKIIGDLKLSVLAEKLEVNPNEPVNITVEVLGEGNLEDVESFKPYLKDVNVFDEKLLVKGNKLTQKLVFVGESDFTIPSFELVFFNTKTAKVQKIKTEPINIKVNGSTQKSKIKIKRDETSVQPTKKVEVVKTKTDVRNNYALVAISFVIGLFIGMILMRIKFTTSTKKVKKLNFKDEKLLLMKLLPFKDIDSNVQNVIDTLENNIYSKEKKSLDKKLLKEIVDKYNIT